MKPSRHGFIVGSFVIRNTIVGNSKIGSNSQSRWKSASGKNSWAVSMNRGYWRTMGTKPHASRVVRVFPGLVEYT